MPSITSSLVSSGELCGQMQREDQLFAAPLSKVSQFSLDAQKQKLINQQQQKQQQPPKNRISDSQP